MKRIYAFMCAALLSLSAFASADVIPTDEVLADYYESGDVCVCIYVPADLDCNNIVLTGSFNSWSNNPAACAAFEPVTGYDGWYVTSYVPEETPGYRGLEAKPIILDKDGGFNWEYQIGAATYIRGGVQMVLGSFAGEIDLVGYGTDAPNVYKVDAWKKNPCAAVYHTYTITVISDGCDGLAVPFLIGAMNNWQFEQMPLDETKTTANGAPTYSVSFVAAEGTPYQIVSGTKDPSTGEIDEMPTWNEQCYMQEKVDGAWVRYNKDSNIELGSDAAIVYDLRSETLRWARCQSEEHVVVIAYLPSKKAPKAVEIVGDFDGWMGTEMEYIDMGSSSYYYAEFDAKALDRFTFLSADTWDQWIQYYSEGEWYSLSSLYFGDLWVDSDWQGNPVKAINLDLSDAFKYRWSGSSTGIDNASANNTKVYGDKERVIVTNAPANDLITVYSESGSVVKRVQANSDRMVINLPQGLYIVRVNNLSVKVLL